VGPCTPALLVPPPCYIPFDSQVWTRTDLSGDGLRTNQAGSIPYPSKRELAK
ncbi:unnamed protein product, partial [Closterium sp. Naga37s-1]